LTLDFLLANASKRVLFTANATVAIALPFRLVQRKADRHLLVPTVVHRRR
jgi:hypothetical protein